MNIFFAHLSIIDYIMLRLTCFNAIHKHGLGEYTFIKKSNSFTTRSPYMTLSNLEDTMGFVSRYDVQRGKGDLNFWQHPYTTDRHTISQRKPLAAGYIHHLQNQNEHLSRNIIHLEAHVQQLAQQLEQERSTNQKIQQTICALG